MYTLFLLNAILSGKCFIRNTELPTCRNCVYFIEHTYPYDPIPSDYGKCKKFGEVDLVTGAIEYDFAKSCRDNIDKCGKHGSQYQKKNE